MLLKNFTIKKILLSLFLFFLATIAAISVIILVNNYKRVNLIRKWPAPGIILKISDSKMHLLIEGEGNKKIIFLSGYKTASPVIDFRPLANLLKRSYKTVIIENFGYGWSENSFKKRSVNNLVEENRTALKMAGIEPPYILTVHSISGLYALYWANKYPQEIEVIIGIDTSVPSQFNNSSLTKKSLIIPFISGVDKKSLEEILPQENYSFTDNYLYNLMLRFHKNDINQISEGNQLENNLLSIKGLNFPTNIPTLFLISSDTQEISQNWEIDWLNEHKKQLKDHNFSKIKTLEGGHYLYRDIPDECSKEIFNFLNYVFAYSQQ